MSVPKKSNLPTIPAKTIGILCPMCNKYDNFISRKKEKVPEGIIRTMDCTCGNRIQTVEIFHQNLPVIRRKRD